MIKAPSFELVVPVRQSTDNPVYKSFLSRGSQLFKETPFYQPRTTIHLSHNFLSVASNKTVGQDRVISPFLSIATSSPPLSCTGPSPGSHSHHRCRLSCPIPLGEMPKRTMNTLPVMPCHRINKPKLTCRIALHPHLEPGTSGGQNRKTSGTQKQNSCEPLTDAEHPCALLQQKILLQKQAHHHRQVAEQQQCHLQYLILDGHHDHPPPAPCTLHSSIT